MRSRESTLGVVDLHLLVRHGHLGEVDASCLQTFTYIHLSSHQQALCGLSISDHEERSLKAWLLPFSPLPGQDKLVFCKSWVFPFIWQ